MLPLDLSSAGVWVNNLVFLLIGLGFGAALEQSGFGDSRNLAAQFYLHNMRVLKTMFSAILTACLLLFLSAAMGWLDFSKIFVNQTYLWPGIVGGLIMGVGFVIGGYCPGTSLVSAASLKGDGAMFVAGTLVGAGIFGEVADRIGAFWNGSYTERLLLSDVFGWSLGATVVAVTVLALVFFFAGEKVEEWMATGAAPRWMPANGKYMSAGALALVVALFIWGKGMPSPEEKWEIAGGEWQAQLDQREVFIHPLEYVKTWNDAAVRLVTLDLRDSTAYAAFHLDAARSVTYPGLLDEALVFELDQLPPQGVVVLVSDDEAAALAAWKRLKMQGVSNLYILDQGVKGWGELFAPLQAHHGFDLSRPPARVLEAFPEGTWQAKIKLKTARRAGGLCS